MLILCVISLGSYASALVFWCVYHHSSSQFIHSSWPPRTLSALHANVFTSHRTLLSLMPFVPLNGPSWFASTTSEIHSRSQRVSCHRSVLHNDYLTLQVYSQALTTCFRAEARGATRCHHLELWVYIILATRRSTRLKSEANPSGVSTSKETGMPPLTTSAEPHCLPLEWR